MKSIVYKVGKFFGLVLTDALLLLIVVFIEVAFGRAIEFVLSYSHNTFLVHIINYTEDVVLLFSIVTVLGNAFLAIREFFRD